MRIALVHNAGAGKGDYQTEDLESLLESAGHDVKSYCKDERDIKRAVRSKRDVVVVSGGDGTVASVALAIHRKGAKIPLYILPTGTSNNIATSLGIGDDISGLALALSGARASRFTIGVVKTPWGKRRFVEGAGFGFIGTMLEQDGTVRERLGRAKRSVMGLFGPKLNGAQRSYRGVARLVRQQRVVECRVRLDGENLDGDYIAIEVLNISRIGPRLTLAPDADACDRRFDVLLVRPSDREALASFVERGLSPDGPPPGIVRRVKHAEISWPRSSGHVDDEPWPGEENGHRARTRKARIERDGRIEILLPDS